MSLCLSLPPPDVLRLLNRFLPLEMNFVVSFLPFPTLVNQRLSELAKNRMCLYAAQLDNVDLFQWARAQKCPVIIDAICEQAAKHASQNILTLLAEENVTFELSSFVAAARWGRLETLQWLHQQTCTSKITKCGFKCCLKPKVACSAAYGGHLHILKWLKEVSSAIRSKYVFVEAAAGGNLTVFQWIENNIINISYDHRCVTAAMEEGRLEMVKYLVSKGRQVLSRAYYCTAKCNHLHILQWLHSVALLDMENSCIGASAGGHLHILQWLQQIGADIPSTSIATAARSGYIEVVKWLLQQGCRVNKVAWFQAARGGQVEVLKLLQQHTCPHDTWAHYGAAVGGHIPTLQWLFENYFPRKIFNCPPAYLALVTELNPGILNMIVNLRTPGVPRIFTLLTIGAAAAGNIEVLEWLYQRGIKPNQLTYDETMSKLPKVSAVRSGAVKRRVDQRTEHIQRTLQWIRDHV